MTIPSPTTHTVDVKGPSSYTTERKKGGSAPAAGANFSAVTDVRGALAVCSAAVKTDRTVTNNSIGRASSVLS